MSSVAVVGNPRKAAHLACLLATVAGVSPDEIIETMISPDPPKPFIFDRELNAPIIQLALERKLRKKARRTLKHALMKLYVEKTKKELDVTSHVAKAQFQTLWARARKQTRFIV